MAGLPVELGLFLRDAPPEIHLVHVDEVFPATLPQLGEHKSGQEVTFPMHVPECWRDEHPSCSPSEIYQHSLAVISYLVDMVVLVKT